MPGTAEPAEALTLIDLESLPDGYHRITAPFGDTQGMRLSVWVWNGRLTGVSVHGMESPDAIDIFTRETIAKTKRLDNIDDDVDSSSTTLFIRSDA